MDQLTMGVRDARRLGAVEAAVKGRISNQEGAQRTGLSVRQFKRLKAKVRKDGAAGIVHGNRGRTSSRRLGDETRKAVEVFLEHGEVRFNDCHIRDLLAEKGHVVSAETVRQIRRQMGLPAKHRRRPARYHRRRLREAQRGAMVQMDGSPFHWFGPDQPSCCLIGMIDDATGEILALSFRPQEDLHGYVSALRDMIRSDGVPLCLYGDRTGIAVRNDRYWSIEEELAGKRRPTQFGRILEELGIRYIAAHSPEAKGRVERSWQTQQDRLAAELALHGIRTPEAAEAFLPTYLVRYRAWFAQTPRDLSSAFLKAPRDLERILACRYERAVARDNTVSVPGCLIQLPPGPGGRSWHASRVEVRELLDGRLLVLHQGQILTERPTPPGEFLLAPRGSGDSSRRAPRSSDPRPHVQPLKQPERIPKRGGSGLTPPKSHPWKKRPFLRPDPNGAEGRRG